MDNKKKPVDKLLESLQERAKELNCLYRIEELLNAPDAKLDEVARGIIEVIPPGWQYPDFCQVRITIESTNFESPGFRETPWVQSADIEVQGRVVGTINVSYTKETPPADDGPFLKEETRLIEIIADRLGHFVQQYRMRNVYQEWNAAFKDLSQRKRDEWQVVLELLQQTDRDLFTSISHKMLNYLCWSGIPEAEELLRKTSLAKPTGEDEFIDNSNRPFRSSGVAFPTELWAEVFRIAAGHMTGEEIFDRLQKWIQEDKLSFLVHVVNRNLSLAEVADAIRRYYHIATQEESLGTLSPSKIGITVSLIRRFLSDQLQYINVAKNYVVIKDFYDLLRKMIFSSVSHGKLGGKSAGMFLASQIIKKHKEVNANLGNLKIPKTWYITSDMLLHFMHYNNLDESVEQKYKDIQQVRFEYPHIIQSFKNSHFPSDFIQGLSLALDDFGDRPLIVRSSSLLEDRIGAAFSGKYKSVFVPNQGRKQKRLHALLDAIAEVYASTFGPDPIEYRSERGLIDFAEEMGIMIQEVVGTRVGDYFFPAFAGVAFSHNEFRWSTRIKRDDGLVRIVPGLGTRAVDRLSDDYPAMFAPGQPGLRVNISVDDILRYTPKKVDAINLKENIFETIDVHKVFAEYGHEIPILKQIVSIYKEGHISKPAGVFVDLNEDNTVVTFDGLVSDTPFMKQMHYTLRLLEEKLGTPVDIEFAHDGQDLYLLQCRAQTPSDDSRPASIPTDIPAERFVFSANKYISNGAVPDLTHIVYVDPEKYGELSTRDELVAVGRCISRLNTMLPKRRFILIGPGRWGSRGDIKLGVKVTYSDINNTAVLAEVARKKGNYTPDLSFGTHFFQDLVEARIRYLPLFPDEPGVVFNEKFLTRSKNILAEITPEYASLQDTVKLIDVSEVSNGMVLRVLLNASLEQAVGILVPPGEVRSEIEVKDARMEVCADSSWQWRYQMAECIASRLDPDRFGVKGLYIFGSTKTASARAGSDIDLLVHFSGTPEQRKELENWFEGWSLSLGELNYLRTGHKNDGLLDVHIVTDEDIEKKTSYAVKIGAVTDPARPLPLKKRAKE